MGLSLEFIAGDADLILQAVRDFDLDALCEPPACLHRADFSLHIVPQDLNTMSESIGEAAGIAPLTLRPFLTVSVDGQDGGALSISEEWVSYVAQCPSSLASAVSERWLQKMRSEHPNESIDLTPEMTEAVVELIHLCSCAKERNLPVIHIWYP